jgi:type II protein arginine methyltransferase
MARAGHVEAARHVTMAALRADPAGLEVRALARSLMAETVPQWHFGLVRDLPRNQAYEQALQRVVRPGMRVLEIGTGTGLLAMLAARAGAAEVITCEMNPAVAETAREIVARNGYADRVKVVAKHSGDLKLGVDLSDRADVLVSEIISSNVVGELALQSIEPVRKDLLKPEAIIIPALVSARVALAEAPAPREMNLVSGFDLSPFNRLLRPIRMVGVDSPAVTLRSSAHDLLSVDFQSGRFAFGGRASAQLRSTGGRVNAVVQWLFMDMDGLGTVHENRPALGFRSAWGAAVHHLPSPIETSPGQPFAVTGAHDLAGLNIWAEPA